MLVFTDVALAEVSSFMSSREPECGGALLGVPDSNLITKFIADPYATVSGASYFPSNDLTGEVQTLEERYGIEFKGIVHSHPGALDRPSGQDLNAFRLGLDLNRTLRAFVGPIVTLDRAAKPNNLAELPIGDRGRLRGFLAYRGSESHLPVDLAPVSCTTMPIMAHIAELENGLAGAGETTSNDIGWGYLEINGTLFISATLQIVSCEVVVLFPPSYPITKPSILVTKHGGHSTQELSFSWGLPFPRARSLWEFCQTSLTAALEGQKGETDEPANE